MDTVLWEELPVNYATPPWDSNGTFLSSASPVWAAPTPTQHVFVFEAAGTARAARQQLLLIQAFQQHQLQPSSSQEALSTRTFKPQSRRPGLAWGIHKSTLPLLSWTSANASKIVAKIAAVESELPSHEVRKEVRLAPPPISLPASLAFSLHQNF